MREIVSIVAVLGGGFCLCWLFTELLISAISAVSAIRKKQPSHAIAVSIRIIAASLFVLVAAYWWRCRNEVYEGLCHIDLRGALFSVHVYASETDQETDLNVLDMLNEHPEHFSRFTGVCRTLRRSDPPDRPLTREESDYEYMDSFDLRDDIDLPIVWDKEGNHRGGRNVVFLGGRNGFLKEIEFQELMKSLRVNENKKSANKGMKTDQ